MTFEDDLNMILEEAGGHISYCFDNDADEKLAIVSTFKERCLDKQRVREVIDNNIHAMMPRKREKILKELGL